MEMAFSASVVTHRNHKITSADSKDSKRYDHRYDVIFYMPTTNSHILILAITPVANAPIATQTATPNGPTR
jgi:hypothetical protein